MKLTDILIPPEHRSAVQKMREQSEEPDNGDNGIAAHPVQVEIVKSETVAGMNGEIINGRSAISYKADRPIILLSKAVTDGNFVDSVKVQDSGIIADTVIISAPPNGITYCVSLGGRGIAYQQDGWNTGNMPQAEFYTTNTPGAAYTPLTVHLPRRRQHCSIGIWTPQNVPAGASFALSIIWSNLGNDL